MTRIPGFLAQVKTLTYSPCKRRVLRDLRVPARTPRTLTRLSSIAIVSLIGHPIVSSVTRILLTPDPDSRKRAHGSKLPTGIAVVPSLVAFALAFTTSRGVRAEASGLPPEIGYNAAETDTPRSLATASAMRAQGIGTTALFYNPANMAVSHLYHITALAQIYPEAGRQSYGGAVVDSVVSSSGLAGGVGGTWNLQDPDGIAREWMDLRGAFAIPVGKMFFVGAGGRIFSLTQNGGGPLGTSPITGGLPGGIIVNTFTLDLGATFKPIPELSIALTGHNLTNPGTGFLPLMAGVGIGYGRSEFSFDVDAVLDTTTYERTTARVMVGGEFLAADVVSLRAGYRYEEGLDLHSISAGLAYIDRRFSIDGAFRRTVSGPEATALVFGFTLHIETLSLGSDGGETD